MLDCLSDFFQTQVVAKSPDFQCDIRSSFATAFKRWRQKNNLPLKKIAKELGVAVATINAWELGKRFPTARNFEMLVNYCGVPPCKLFCIMADKCVPADCLLAMGRKS
jgi:transcriptional regulator with XRE-family HTH domain